MLARQAESRYRRISTFARRPSTSLRAFRADNIP